MELAKIGKLNSSLIRIFGFINLISFLFINVYNPEFTMTMFRYIGYGSIILLDGMGSIFPKSFESSINTFWIESMMIFLVILSTLYILVSSFNDKLFSRVLSVLVVIVLCFFCWLVKDFIFDQSQFIPGVGLVFFLISSVIVLFFTVIRYIKHN